MAKVDKEHIKALADMSHLTFSDQELDELVSEIEAVLTYAERLSSSPYAQQSKSVVATTITECSNMRADTVVAFDSSKILEQAPRRDGDFFVVPSIITTTAKE
jgi:aspartyl/glutamyl-tRNA(Asn/Gln) amidotransferase C subunit